MKNIIFHILFVLSVPVFFLPAPAMAEDGESIELIVIKGDNLINICGKYLQQPGKWPEIGRINHLKNNDRIMPGQRLKIPVWLIKGIPADGLVAYARGDVTVLPDRQSQWRVLRQNDRVRQGSIIRTGHDSGVEIVFDDGASILQQQDTTLGLRTSELKGKQHLLRKLKLSTGRILTKVRRATGKDMRFEIHTPSATAVARGTEFRVASGIRQDTTSEVLDGVIDVKARGKVVSVHEGEGTRIDKGKPPREPRRLLPPPSPLDLESPIRKLPAGVAFEGVTGAVAYRFLLSRDPEGKELLREKVYPVGEPATVAGLEDGLYYVRALSIDDLGIEGLPPPPREMKIRTNPLPPFIQNPAENSKFKGKVLKSRWLQVQDAARYQIQTATDRDFHEVVGDPIETGGTEHKISFAALGTYYFRIRAVATDGYAGAWSDPISFTMIPPPPSPEVEKPELKGGELRIRWGNQGEKVSYHCQVSMDRDYKDLLIDRKLDKPELVMSTPKKPGVYYVRTSTIDPDGSEGDFSPPQTFEIKRRWPYGVGALGVAGIILLILL